MAIAWLLKDDRVTSVLVGASKVSQLHNSLEALNKLDFTPDELQRIEEILK
jgi:L-glyceraldehyde 3-phosphate reductase